MVYHNWTDNFNVKICWTSQSQKSSALVTQYVRKYVRQYVNMSLSPLCPSTVFDDINHTYYTYVDIICTCAPQV